jgi:hypothetical protein
MIGSRRKSALTDNIIVNDIDTVFAILLISLQKLQCPLKNPLRLQREEVKVNPYKIQREPITTTNCL